MENCSLLRKLLCRVIGKFCVESSAGENTTSNLLKYSKYSKRHSTIFSPTFFAGFIDKSGTKKFGLTKGTAISSKRFRLRQASNVQRAIGWMGLVSNEQYRTDTPIVTSDTYVSTT